MGLGKGREEVQRAIIFKRNGLSRLLLGVWIQSSSKGRLQGYQEQEVANGNRYPSAMALV